MYNMYTATSKHHTLGFAGRATAGTTMILHGTLLVELELLGCHYNHEFKEAVPEFVACPATSKAIIDRLDFPWRC